MRSWPRIQRWSPDGRRIAFSQVGDIWVMNADGSDATNLTDSYAPLDDDPSWSPTGRWIAFDSTSRRRINPDIHTFRSNGTRHRNLTRSTRSFDVDVAWSPDGRRLVFAGVSGGKRDIYVMSADGRNLTNLTNDPEGTRNSDPAWSP
jgi:TolB protein